MAMAVPQLCLAGSASAHPHVFIDNQVVLRFEAGVMTGFHTDWRFDEIFTADMVMQFDTDGDGQISDRESETIGAETLPNLALFHYFTYVDIDGQRLDQLAPSGFLARVENEALHFRLIFTLPAPVDPRHQNLRLEISDREYYVEVLMAEADPVRLEGDGVGTCRANVADDPANAYYEGFVIPQAISVSCP